MTYYDDYEDDARYAKEIYWESKDLGYTNPTPVNIGYVRDTQCSKCKRWGTAKSVAFHNERYPDCDK